MKRVRVRNSTREQHNVGRSSRVGFTELKAFAGLEASLFASDFEKSALVNLVRTRSAFRWSPTEISPTNPSFNDAQSSWKAIPLRSCLPVGE